MDLSIIIVSFNTRERLRENLKSIFSSEINFSYEVFVVDNNSKDGSVEMLENEFKNVKLISNQENKGFSFANNQAIKEAQGDFILLLNPDMKLFKDSLKKALDCAKNKPEAVVSSCKLVDESSKIIFHVRKFPKLFDQLAIVLKLPHIFPFLLNKYIPKNFDYNKDSKVDSVRGSFFLINRKTYQKISGKDKPYLDERYFIWFEEVDFCKQIYQLGGEVWYFSSPSCLDYVGKSFSQLKRKKTQLYFRDSMLKYFKKWENKFSYLVIKVAWKIIMIVV